ncbi:MAG: Asp-tRNA(Asn)/Glu-tRNA(Gln) amidotransferase subunit GatC, partial [Bacteroidota bacterium]
MIIDKDTVERIAELARLEFSSADKEAMIQDMNRMLAFVDKLNELDTTGVEPLIFMTDEENVFREDEAHLDITQKQALHN